jgi:DMSO/TMAO reductase YedYZ molybdopterin-dependent catalytic subunit
MKPKAPSLTRREFLNVAAGASFVACFRSALAAQPAVPGGRLLGTVELGAASGAPLPPFGTLLGTGLDARLFTDLSGLAPERLITPNDQFFVRTAFPSTIGAARTAAPDAWTVRLGGLVRAERSLAFGELKRSARPLGPCLLECAGNTNPSNFGLLSAAEWDGVPLDEVLARMQPSQPGTRVLVSGVDDMTQPSRTSVPGASWIFAREELTRAGAFLATSMNGAALPHDHGFPVRLVVPGWYGCTCIKWVDRIELVPDEAAATSQMMEFAQRTHQQGEPALARDFIPATIDTAAMPIRVEKWLADARLVYRIIGIIWGGTKPTNALQIRFRPEEPFVPVSDCPLPHTTRTWSLWSHLWRPATPRRYQIVLRVDDPTLRTRRLDLFFYVREVQIDEV